MSNPFVESEAEESEHDGEDEEEIGQVKKQRKEKRKKQIDSEEEEDDDGEIVKDLIDDNPIEEDSDNESDGSRKRKRSEDEEDFDDRLEDEDYDLLEENLGVKVPRKKQYSKIRRIDDEESDVEETQDRGDEREAIATQLFEGSDHEEERPSRREEAPEQYGSEDSEGEYSETDDFIVDDDGRPITEKRRKRRPIFTDANLQEAQDIFGVDFDYQDFDKYEEEDYEEEEDEEDEDEYENEEQITAKKTKKALRRKKKLKSLYELYEPHELERAGITEEDNRIRNTDIPERMQLRMVPVTSTTTDEELDEESEWIFKVAFSKRIFATATSSDKSRDIPGAPASVAVSEVWGEEENWDTQSAIPAAPISVVSRAPVVETMDVEEDWDKESRIGATEQEGWEKESRIGVTEQEDWDKESRIGVTEQEGWEKESRIGVNEQEGWEKESRIAVTEQEGWEKESRIAVTEQEGWEKESRIAVTEQEDWDKESQITVPPTAPKSTAAGGDGGWGDTTDEQSNWEKESVINAKSTTGGDDEAWPGDATDVQSNWEKASVVGAKSTVGDTTKSMVSLASIHEKSVIQVQEEVKPKVIAKIRKALEFMRNQHLEVPFIAFYRKEYIQPELKINDLWKIYKLDTRFCQLRIRKNRLGELFKNMMDYQTDLIMERPDEPLLESTRLISDDDIDRIKGLKTSEELKDMYLLFSLYYSDDVQLMKEALVRRRKEERQRSRAALMAAAAVDGDDSPIELDPEPEIEPPGVKRKVGGGAYALCKKLGVDGLVKKFGLTPEKFSENLRDNYQRYEVEQYPTDPLETAKEYLNDRLKTEEEALKAAKFMLATQISREPVVRSSVREAFFERSTITVRPTKKGQREIDEAHPCYGMKYVNNKPVRDLKDDQFLKLVIAEEDKLLTLLIGHDIKGLTSSGSGTYVDEVKQLFNKDEYSKLVQDWNDMRGECVEFALEKLLFPVCRKELRSKLLEEAKEFIIDTSTEKLNQWLKVAPYSVTFPEEDDEDWDTSKGLRVLALAYVPDLTQASFATIVTSDGEPTEFVRLQNIMKNLKSFNEIDKKEKLEDLNAIKDLIKTRKPHVVVIGGESRDALMLRDDLRAIISEVVQEDSFPSINVEIIDNELSKVYANSHKAQSDFREYPLILKQAISLGRRMQDPLIEFAQLVNHDDEILCLRFHPLQDQVLKEELLENLTTQFVNRTNQVGVDINRCISSPHTMHVAQFICGLGPRKATALIKTLKQNNQRLENRTQLITVCHMGPKIFINCSGFIRIDTSSLGDSTEAYVEVLDGSRVHPETYEWARKMAVDALEYEDDDANPASALEEILETPDRLEELNLDAFAEELERQGFGNKSITLYDIRAELNNRYKDQRNPYVPPNSEEMFNMLTKETPETLYIGKLTTATVVGISHKKPQGEQLDNAIPVRNEDTGMWQCAFCMKNDFPDLSEVWNHFDAGACPGQAIGIRVRFDNGISGFIPILKLSDKPVANPEHRVKRGQTIHCRIVKIDVDRFSIECTSRTSDLVDNKHEWRPPRDVYYDKDEEEKNTKKDEDIKKNKHRQTYVRRVIVHPSFKNISFKELIPMMDQMDQGEVIIRPSSKGSDHLTVSWKVTDGIYQHVDVKEERKENMFSLGQSLRIGAEEYEDLDEIIARFVNPMASHARDIVNYKYFVGGLGGSRAKADEYLREEKGKNSNKIHYAIHPSREYPGKFVLSYLPGSKVQHEFLTVTPDGFRYRQMPFQTLNQALKWFKEHFKDAPPSVSTPVVTPKTHASRTPFATTPGLHADSGSKIVPPPQSHFSVNPAASHTTPHYTTPAQAFTPYSAFTTHTPYTPTASTPYITPYQTPYQSGTATPRNSNPQNASSGGFLHPGSVTPGGYKQNSSQKPPSASQSQPQPPRIPRQQAPANDDGNDWRKAAEAWAKSQQRGSGWSQSQPRPHQTAAQRYLEPLPTQTAAQRYLEPLTDSNKISRGQDISPQAFRRIQQFQRIVENTQNSSALNFIPTRSPRSGRDSLKSTPRTNFSPRSMVESSLGDETPLHDEN